MDDLKNRMYNYEATPPAGVWESIAAELDGDGAKVITMVKKQKYTFYYIAAASIAVIIFLFIFFNNSSNQNDQIITAHNSQNDSASNEHLLMTVPKEKATAHAKTDTINKIIVINKPQKGGPNESKDNVKTKPDSNITANNTRYITIEGPGGQPVKISSKMATLIDSSETKVSTKPVWHKKIDEWRNLMKVNTLAPTTNNFLDIVELTKSLKDNKQ